MCHPATCYFKAFSMLPQAVDELLQLLGVPAEEAVPRPAWHYDDGKTPVADSLQVREALAMCYDLR